MLTYNNLNGSFSFVPASPQNGLQWLEELIVAVFTTDQELCAGSCCAALFEL